jgi:hypothetical protein
MAMDLLPGRTELNGKESNNTKCKKFHLMVKDLTKMILMAIIPGEHILLYQ